MATACNSLANPIGHCTASHIHENQ
jgi:hypothetical protein